MRRKPRTTNAPSGNSVCESDSGVGAIITHWARSGREMSRGRLVSARCPRNGMMPPAVNDPPNEASNSGRPAGIGLAPGILPRHLVTYLYAAFVTIGLLAFVSFMQPYLMNVNLRLPPEVQGRTVAALNFANELLALCLVAPFGALADKIGRRAVYACGLLWLAAGFLLYAQVRTVVQLAGCSLFFSVGVAAVGTML